MSHHDEHLAYGEYHGDPNAPESDRGVFGDAFHRMRQTFHEHDHPPPEQQDASAGHGPQATSGGAFFMDKIADAVHDVGHAIKSEMHGGDRHGHGAVSTAPTASMYGRNRFQSFAPERQGNDIKWFVDGCGYFYAVSLALERAQREIWILDWWLTPELYLRRPPAKNEQYRLDRMLQAAAERGVKINVIVYKEVEGSLTLDSAHTKHALEKLHHNIAVFRHPDHLPDTQTFISTLASTLHNTALTPAGVAKLPQDVLKAVYGVKEDTVLYWAHHEKLCIIDEETAFMGGLDLCFGRWDTNQHSITDVHPEDLNNIIFPGQDYNNARIMDFHDVSKWQNNALDRTKDSRMGWSDVSMCLRGPSVNDLRLHFVERWNFIYDEKYEFRKVYRYGRLHYHHHTASFGTTVGQAASAVEAKHHPFQGKSPYQAYHPDSPSDPTAQHQSPTQPQAQNPQQPPLEATQHEDTQHEGAQHEQAYTHPTYHPHLGRMFSSGPGHERLRDRLKEEFEEGVSKLEGSRVAGEYREEMYGSLPGNVNCQLTRSCSKWSHGVALEHSIQNAYCEVIKTAQHFVYIENQFFITATGDKQKPVQNLIGEAIVERVLRADRNKEIFKMIIVIPAIPGFAGDLRTDEALSTRAIMDFQYKSINKGGNSIFEMINAAGVNPVQYIRFYNLRNYDRINVSKVLKNIEQETGVSYNQARAGHDQLFGTSQGGAAPVALAEPSMTPPPEISRHLPPTQPHPQALSTQAQVAEQSYAQYQQDAKAVAESTGSVSGKWDSVAACYMMNGPDIRSVPWEDGDVPEIDAFVSEELYIHTKVLIADDRIVICGSANLNDRSQLGSHDSEIAMVVEDTNVMDSTMNGQPWRVNKFAASLRRQLTRKHLGLLPPQDWEKPNNNFKPIGASNEYDWNSEEDQMVADPLGDLFVQYWNSTARTNTDAFRKVFHPVPDDSVRNWKQYDDYYEKFFKLSKQHGKTNYSKWGHVVTEEFSPGPAGAREVKEELSKIRGNIVEMPLLFLRDENLAKESFSVNAITEVLYT